LTTTIRTEKRKRGLFGWVFLILFWGYNALMAFSFWAGLTGNSNRMATLSTDAERTGFMAGTAIGAGMILIIWAAGALILGLFVLLTQGKKVIVETVKD
jgi:hypothetical protein